MNVWLAPGTCQARAVGHHTAARSLGCRSLVDDNLVRKRDLVRGQHCGIQVLLYVLDICFKTNKDILEVLSWKELPVFVFEFS